jgi:ABC-type glutathione transport system ATPase component
MSRALIRTCDLTVSYRPASADPVLALNRVSLQISPGEIVGILGESGSGKSTLASAILQLLPSSTERDGTIFFQDIDLTRLSERELREIRGRHIGMIPQDPASSLNPVMRVGIQIAEVLRAHLQSGHRLGRRERENRVNELLEEVGFDDPERIGSSYPHQLSGGQRQRVVIAQAIACRPELIIADEPTSKLDTPLQTQIIELIAKIVRSQNTALLWITHDPATLAGFADRVAVMHNGRIVEEGGIDDVFRRPNDSYTAMLMRLSRELILGTLPAKCDDHVL